MNARRNVLASWWALGLAEKVELIAVLSLALAAEIAVKVFPLPRLASTLGIELIDHASTEGKASKGTASMSDETIARRARMVDRVYRHWPRKNSCLRRALVLGYRVRAASPTLVIGVAREGTDIRAHAWIEIDGKVIGDQSGDWAPLRPYESHG